LTVYFKNIGDKKFVPHGSWMLGGNYAVEKYLKKHFPTARIKTLENVTYDIYGNKICSETLQITFRNKADEANFLFRSASGLEVDLLMREI
jgi:hypothetical protein